MTTHHALFYHLIWSTKNREPFIHPLIEQTLHRYITGIINAKKASLIQIGGMPDHIHILLTLSPDQAISKLVKDIKISSTKWIREQNSSTKSFSWQEGFGAFSVSKSNTDAVQKYIVKQKEHHKKSSFEEEFIQFLEKHEIEYDRKYVFK